MYERYIGHPAQDEASFLAAVNKSEDQLEVRLVYTAQVTIRIKVKNS